MFITHKLGPYTMKAEQDSKVKLTRNEQTLYKVNIPSYGSTKSTHEKLNANQARFLGLHARKYSKYKRTTPPHKYVMK